MQAGRLKHRVALESLEDGTNPATGLPQQKFVPQGSVWAEVAPISGREYIVAHALDSETNVRITIRYRADVTAEWRIIFRNLYYGITAVLPDPFSGLDWLTLPCTQVASDTVPSSKRIKNG